MSIEIVTVWGPVFLLVMMSGLFSGLTLGLLSLDINALEIVIEGGTEEEKKYATRILPIRSHGNWLLCTLLLGNVAVNAMLSILLADMTSGLMGFFSSTALIVIFGEIMPQAACSRYGLVVGYYTVPLVWVIVAVCAPLAWPISVLLDKALGQEMGQIYTRNMFKVLLKQHANELTADFAAHETKMMQQVIELKERQVSDIMTPLDKVFMVDYNDKLDFDQLAKIMECGHSRIPVYDKDPALNIVGLLYVKDLVLLNPDDEFKIKDILHFYNHVPVTLQVDDMHCGVLLQEILLGSCHMAVCRRIEEDPAGGDNRYVNIGIVTLEDVTAMLLGSHEPEESAEGSYTPTSSHKNSTTANFIDMFRRKKTHNSLTPTEINGIYEILRAKVPAFKPSEISSANAKRLLKAQVICEVDSDHVIYAKGVVAESLTLILEGHVDIVTSKENFVVEVGPWTPIATQALSAPGYLPDFNAKPRQGGGPIKFLNITLQTYEEFRHWEELMKSSTTLKRFGSEAKLNLISAAAAEESTGVSDTTSNPLESVAKRSGSSSRATTPKSDGHSPVGATGVGVEISLDLSTDPH